MTDKEKIAVLSQALSKHLHTLRRMGGLYSLSCTEDRGPDSVSYEIDWRGFTGQNARITKKTEEDALPHVVRVMQEILTAEAAASRAYHGDKINALKELDDAVLNTTEPKNG